jgi:hypothetical protein
MVIMTGLKTVGQKLRNAPPRESGYYKSDWHFMHIPIILPHDQCNAVSKKISAT